MSLTREEALSLVLEGFSGFAPYWEEYRREWSDWPGEPPGFCLEIAEFSRYLAAVIAGEDEGDLPAAFALVERFMVEGDEEVHTAAATCCLENTMNRTPSLDPARFVPLMGPKSRAYCRAWDEFCGVRTAGLWDD